MRLGAGAQSSDIRTHDRALANVFEAVLGAVYLDGGLAPAKALVGPLIEAQLSGADADLERFAKNPVSELQEWAQRNGLRLPEYKARTTEPSSREGQEWEVEATVDGLPPQKGLGATKAQARRRAAARMLDVARAAPLVGE